MLGEVGDTFTMYLSGETLFIDSTTAVLDGEMIFPLDSGVIAVLTRVVVSCGIAMYVCCAIVLGATVIASGDVALVLCAVDV